MFLAAKSHTGYPPHVSIKVHRRVLSMQTCVRQTPARKVIRSFYRMSHQRSVLKKENRTHVSVSAAISAHFSMSLVCCYFSCHCADISCPACSGNLPHYLDGCGDFKQAWPL
ncbi:hypothetical protein FKM82_023194 [Ascaphus truei]